MTDPFFNFDASSSNHEIFNEEDDDTDYDALNNETFGEDAQTTDWEEVHEKSLQLEKRSFDDENNELSERVASCILDDEGEELLPKPKRNVHPGQADPSVWWRDTPSSKTTEHGGASTPISETWWNGNNPNTIPFPVSEGCQASALPKLTKIMTVEELEKKMRQEATCNTASNNTAIVNRQGNYLELDTELQQHLGRDHTMNGYRSRPPMRGRYLPHHEGLPDPTHHVHKMAMPDMLAALSPRPGPVSHNMYRPNVPPGPLGPPLRLHSGHTYPRQLHDSRFIGHGSRRPPPMPDHAPMYYHQQPYGPGLFPPQPADEYAGLMSHHEKHWISSIQMMQLNSNQPYQDDYYYIMHQQRQQGNSGRKLGNHTLKNNREVGAAKPAVYTPLQFENSLGKLQIGSVMAPRKIIDMDLVENVENNSKQEKKSKQILIEVESIFNAILEIEDYLNPLVTPPVTTKSEVDLIAQMIQTASAKIIKLLLVENKLISILAVRKGRNAVLRLLPLISNPGQIVHRFLLDLVPITKKDSSEHLLSFLPAIRTYLSSVPLTTLVDFMQNYETSFLLSNKFTISVMANMVERAEQVVKDCDDDEILQKWVKTLQRLGESTENWIDTERPVVALDQVTLTRHLMLISNTAWPEHITALIRVFSNRTQTTVPN